MSAQSDQFLCGLHMAGVIPLVSMPKISRLLLISVDKQACLCLTAFGNHEDRFSHDQTRYMYALIRLKKDYETVNNVIICN